MRGPLLTAAIRIAQELPLNVREELQRHDSSSWNREGARWVACPVRLNLLPSSPTTDRLEPVAQRDRDGIQPCSLPKAKEKPFFAWLHEPTTWIKPAA